MQCPPKINLKLQIVLFHDKDSLPTRNPCHVGKFLTATCHPDRVPIQYIRVYVYTIYCKLLVDTYTT